MLGFSEKLAVKSVAVKSRQADRVAAAMAAELASSRAEAAQTNVDDVRGLTQGQLVTVGP